MDAGGRVTQDDSMDGIGRVVSGTKTEQLPGVARVRGGYPNTTTVHSMKNCMERGVIELMGTRTPKLELILCSSHLQEINRSKR
jgi:hypothetical protein